MRLFRPDGRPTLVGHAVGTVAVLLFLALLTVPAMLVCAEWEVVCR